MPTPLPRVSYRHMTRPAFVDTGLSPRACLVPEFREFFFQNLGGSRRRRKFREIWVGRGTFASQVEFREIFAFRSRSGDRAEQLHTLADFVQGSLMLRYNKRNVG